MCRLRCTAARRWAPARGEELATVLSRNTFHWVLAFAESGLLTPAVFDELDRLREIGDPPRLDEPRAGAGRAGRGRSRAAGAAPGQRNAGGRGEFGPGAAARSTRRCGRRCAGGRRVRLGPDLRFLCASEDAAIDVGAQLSGAGVCRTVRVAAGPVPRCPRVPAPTDPDDYR